MKRSTVNREIHGYPLEADKEDGANKRSFGRKGKGGGWGVVADRRLAGEMRLLFGPGGDPLEPQI